MAQLNGEHQQYKSVWKYNKYGSHGKCIYLKEEDQEKLSIQFTDKWYLYTHSSSYIKSLANPWHKLNKSQFTHLPLLIIHSHQLLFFVFSANFRTDTNQGREKKIPQSNKLSYKWCRKRERKVECEFHNRLHNDESNSNHCHS